MSRMIWFGRLALILSMAAPTGMGSSLTARAAEETGAVPLKPALPSQMVDRLVVRYVSDRIVSAQNLPELPAGLDAAATILGMDVEYVQSTADGGHVLRLASPVDAATAERMAGQLEAYPNVDYAEPDYRKQALFTPGDTLFSAQWALTAPGDTHYGINAIGAWDLTTGDPDLTVAVIDTGVLLTHPEFADRIWPGYDFVSDAWVANDGDERDADATDPGDWTSDDNCGFGWTAQPSSWHGTHVSGIIGAAGDNGTGTAGVTWGTRILPVRVLGRCGGFDSDITDALYWAAGLPVAGVPDNPHPARVLNLSLGGPGLCSPLFQNAIDAVRAVGAVVVVAAGNSATDVQNVTPANCSGVIAVGATDRNGNLARYSDYGSGVDVSAPGGAMSAWLDPNGILSTYNEGEDVAGTMGFATLQGTSMAAPHVAGVAALMLSINPSLDADQVEGLMKSTLTPLPAGSQCNSRCGDSVVIPCTAELCGHGIVNAAAAVAMAASLTERQYLPLVANSLSIVPVAAFADDFESTRQWPWVSRSSVGQALIVSAPVGFPARSGQRVVWLGGIDAESASIERTVFVDPQSTRLTFWQWIASGETTVGADHGRLLVDGQIVWETDLSAAAATGRWVTVDVDLSAYAGQVVSLRFEALTDAQAPSSWLIDDASLMR